MLKKIVKIILQVIPYLFFLIAIVLILQIVISIRNDKTPTILGFGMFLVVTPSMEDTIMTGDLIFIHTSFNESDLLEGDIVTFEMEVTVNGNTGIIINTHRIIEIDEIDGVKYFTTKGDNNSSSDPNEIDFLGGKIIGVYHSKSGFLGSIYHFIFSGGINFIYALAVLVFLIIAFTEVLNIIKTLSNAKKQAYLEEKAKLIQTELEKLKQNSNNDIEEE